MLKSYETAPIKTVSTNSISYWKSLLPFWLHISNHKLMNELPDSTKFYYQAADVVHSVITCPSNRDNAGALHAEYLQLSHRPPATQQQQKQEEQHCRKTPKTMSRIRARNSRSEVALFGNYVSGLWWFQESGQSVHISKANRFL